MDYVLTRDFLDNNRINLQHYLWIELFGYHIHPTIPTTSPTLRIADIGTGTGVWLTDQARRLPSTVFLEGLDVSFDATPPQELLPPNVNLREYNILGETPPDLQGLYDIVHIRNFSFVLKNDQVEQVIRNLYQLLKPGGYIQWGEPDVSSFRIEKSDPENKIGALTELIQIGQGQDGRLRPTWVPKLPRYFQEIGMEGVESDVKEPPPHLAFAKHECNLIIHELISRKTQNAAVGEKLNHIIPAVARETQQGSYWAFTRWTVIGRKPLPANGM
ncbi:hypothetical protein BDV38DRAFT_291811 [Aspergillus pseudotamarii]|uniref:Methyltransferase domain-containing protein n=1 Tax=Aspergillus pseudotamarii TaxID=132259 RepID=A0A5N6SY87_ASPPS|nr:uncharacterized protein BDV38DRAFT_291811 [Aspergillus pseudotamarii]KAE8138749.1 hypothetical protein BDV38DRAFT_291811 [Aspergillus pseudotamarii]